MADYATPGSAGFQPASVLPEGFPTLDALMLPARNQVVDARMLLPRNQVLAVDFFAAYENLDRRGDAMHRPRFGEQGWNGDTLHRELTALAKNPDREFLRHE